jgi:hypothetical protein
MDAMDDRYNYASPLTGHQDPVPNSDAARLRLDSPTYMRVPGLADRIGNPRLGHPTPERLIGGERRTVEGSYADIYCTLVAQL